MKPYSDPQPRSFIGWCQDLGLEAKGKQWPANQIMTYEEFCFLSETELRRVTEGPLYGFWHQFGDVFGEARTVKEWLNDIGWHIVEPTKDDLKDMNLFLGHDEFWEWSSGKIEQDNKESDGISVFEKLKKLFGKK